MHNKRLHGIIVPMITPLTASQKIDHDSTKRLIDYLIDGGVHGLFLLGSAGEGPLMPVDMQRELVEITLEHTSGRVPIMVGVSAASTERCLLNIQNFKDLPVDAYVSTLPFYFNTVGEHQLKHFATIAEQAPAPLIIYNIPMRVKDKIELKVILELANNPKIIGLKDTSGDLPNFRRILEETEDYPDFRIFIGETRLMDVAIYLGADGVVSTDANVGPESCVAVYEAASKGDWNTAQQKQKIVNLERRAMEAKKAEGINFLHQLLKHELVKKGIITSSTVMLPY